MMHIESGSLRAKSWPFELISRIKLFIFCTRYYIESFFILFSRLVSYLIRWVIMNKMERCEICSEDSSQAEKLRRLYGNCFENLIKQCRLISDSSLLERLVRKWTSNISITVHQRCRALFMQNSLILTNKSMHHDLNAKNVSQSVNGKRKSFICLGSRKCN